MRLSILAHGRAGRGPEAELVQRYLKRIPWPVDLREIDARSEISRPDGSRRVVLDERGTALSSADLAARLGGWREDGVREAQFLIGPADGHEAALRNSADLMLSFGPATFPHLMVRAMLAEQLYRAVSILSGHPYHRE